MGLLDPIFNPLLNMNPFLAVFIVSLVLSVVITIIYKYMTDQELMKTLKDDIKVAQKEMKLFKDDPEKMLKLQKKAMEHNMKYMMQSMKPTLVTFIPIILIFGWLNANFAYEPIQPGQEFDVKVSLSKDVFGTIEIVPPKANNSVILLENEAIKQIDSREMSYKFKAINPGKWDLLYRINNKTDYPFTVMISNTSYSTPVINKFSSGREIKQITIGNSKKIVLDIFGWKIGWLMTYIILSIVFSMGLRKVLKLH